MADSMPVFLDTAFVFALINTRDQWHAKAKTLERAFNAERRPLVTSEFVLMSDDNDV
jgi:predicted nucleic acid-binding protein